MHTHMDIGKSMYKRNVVWSGQTSTQRKQMTTHTWKKKNVITHDVLSFSGQESPIIL